MVKYFLLVLIVLFFVASDPFFGEKTFWNPQQVKTDADPQIVAIPWASSELIDKYLRDPDNRVLTDFKIPEYFEDSVRFWFLCYTQFTSNHIVLHDKNKLGLIYKVLDFHTLREKNLNRHTLYNLQRKLTNDNIEMIRSGYDQLIANPFLRNAETGLILNAIHHAKIPLSEDDVLRRKLFKSLKTTVRSQTGQADYIQQGLVRSSPYQKYLLKIFEARGLPYALLAIPFLESSFNPVAESKVGALGVWQFMPFISRHYLPKHNGIDYRRNVILSSLAASFLLEENLKILKRWDLAVTAYNSGTKHLVKMRRSLAAENLDLALIIENSGASESFGFASKNFYSEFLALVHTMSYRDEIFDEVRKEDEHQDVKDFNIYLAKCTIRLKNDMKWNDDTLESFMKFNHHLTDNKPLQRATIVTTPMNLPGKYFHKINLETIRKMKPKDWEKGLKSYSCSTR